MSAPTTETSQELKRALWLADLYALMFEIAALRETDEVRRKTLIRVLEVVPVDLLRVQ